ncbi:MAG: hypothetical protein MJ118_00395 [Clostridia bacterium]|nr:hypothetical protein [Clostridia bacterium]
MINVELSNIWGCVSLPDLLGQEKAIYDAHLKLRNNQPDGPNFLGWLSQPDAVTVRMVRSIRAAADAIRSCADTLIVIGNTSACRAAQAGLALFSDQQENGPQVLFAGTDLSSKKHLELCEALQGREYCLLLAFDGTWQMESSIASRSVRWLMERQYGQKARSRIFVTAPNDSPMAAMAEEESYTFLPLESGAASCSLNSTLLLILNVCGIDPIGVLEGAAEAYESYDLRAFENPVWMYAGARRALLQLGKHTELLGYTEPALSAFGLWWQQSVLQSCSRIQPVRCLLPQELDRMQVLIDGRLDGFATQLHLPPVCSQKVGVEMDWKDRDGLGYLDGKSVQDVADALSQALSQAHEISGAPQILLECDTLSPQSFGELLYFFDLANAVCTSAEPASAAETLSIRELLPQILGTQNL